MLLRCPKILLKFSCEAFLENHQLSTGSVKELVGSTMMGSESCLIEVKLFVFDEPVHKPTVDNPFHELAEGAGEGNWPIVLHSEAFLFGFKIGMTVESFRFWAICQ
ncbi:hypothetical protein TNCV_4665961 [Trichonephila clavipes]|nr:hypothetical protein TNCV_4665961 [Trichonephila clavipes]